jgi:hypothetical protein
MSGLARFQDRLLKLLSEKRAPADIRAALLAEPSLAEFHDYIGSMDDHMLEVARELVGKWSTRGKPS